MKRSIEAAVGQVTCPSRHGSHKYPASAPYHQQTRIESERRKRGGASGLLKCAMGLAVVLFLSRTGLSQTASTGTAIDLASQARNVDFSGFPFTRPIQTGAALPSTCQVGQLYFNSVTAAGSNLFACTA